MGEILVIDDESGITELIAEVLTKFGHRVTTAADGQQGIDCLQKAGYDLVITDMRMPGTDGCSVVAHIRASQHADTPIIGISGTPWLLDGQACDAVLPKPFPLQRLVAAVDRLAGASRQSAEAAAVS